MPPNDPKPPNPERDDDLVVEEERKIQRPKRWKVLFHNDDYTTKEFVIEVLVPEGVDAEVVLPDGRRELVGGGRHTFASA